MTNRALQVGKMGNAGRLVMSCLVDHTILNPRGSRRSDRSRRLMIMSPVVQEAFALLGVAAQASLCRGGYPRSLGLARARLLCSSSSCSSTSRSRAMSLRRAAYAWAAVCCRRGGCIRSRTQDAAMHVGTSKASPRCRRDDRQIKDKPCGRRWTTGRTRGASGKLPAWTHRGTRLCPPEPVAANAGTT